MKTTVLIICLIVLGVFSQNNQAFAHSPDSYTSTIYKDANGWNLQVTFGSYGILESLKKYSKDYELQLSNSSKFKTHVADPLIPILLSIELVETPFLGPKEPSSLT